MAPGTATTVASPNLLAPWRTLCCSAYEDASAATSSKKTRPCSPARRMSSRRCGTRDRRAPHGGRLATSRRGSTRWCARRAPRQAATSARLDHDVFDEMF